MKKIFLIIWGFILVCATADFAVAAGTWSAPGAKLSEISFTLSKNVSIYWEADQDNNTYALGSKHTKGNRVFATTSATNQIYYNESEDYVNTSGASINVSMPSAGQSSFGDDWHTL